MLKTQNLQGTLKLDSILYGCLLGKKSEQEQLYHNFAPKMFAVCLRYASDYHNAEDLLQDGFVKVFNRLNKYNGLGSFEGWMKRIFINTALDKYHKEKQYRCVPLDECFQKGIQAEVLQDLYKNDLIQLIQSLPPGYRKVFNLYVVDGYNHNEIAKLLNITTGTSKSQLARARNLLKQRILDLNERKQ